VLDPIVADELGVLEAVTRLLEEPVTSPQPSEASILEELERLREMLREGEKAEDHAALVEQWNRQTALLNQLRASRQAPQVDRNSPYFAHLRLREGKNERDILIGKATRVQRGVRIVDWRNAPISRIFYCYQQGEEYEEEIAGRSMSGAVVARRTVTIREQRLQRVDAPEGSFYRDAQAPDGWRRIETEAPRLAGGEGAALRAHQVGQGGQRQLGTDLEGNRRRVDKHLPDIAGLIDPSQFDLITRPSAGFVVIRGTAGSGKTTVALHRIAYLAFDDAAIDSGQTMVIVFSPALRDYVGHVLPALGVHHVQVRTFRDWAAEQVRRLFQKLPRSTREDAPGVVQRLKLHPAMLTVLKRQVERVVAEPRVEQVIDDWISALSQADFLAQVFNEVAPGAFSADELARVANWSRERALELNAWLEGDLDSRAEIEPEDDTLLLCAWQLRMGAIPGRGNRPLRYRHIAIDEVQDFSPVEVRVLLGCLDDRQSITLAGDTQQHVMQETGFTSWAEFFQHLGIEGTEVNTLEISYRCSRQIAQFAVTLLGNLREDRTPPRTTREGPSVELFRFTDHGACVAFLADALKHLAQKEPLASVAVLTPSRDLSVLYHRGLLASDVPAIRLVEYQDFTFAPGVEVTEIEQVKGLEFDYVILVEASAAKFPDTPAARRLLHVGATRAVHQLWLTSVATPSPMVREQLGTAGSEHA
jgi:ATP-dependent DNA helicase UvrD/PcrA